MALSCHDVVQFAKHVTLVLDAALNLLDSLIQVYTNISSLATLRAKGPRLHVLNHLRGSS